MCYTAVPGENYPIRAVHCDDIAPLVPVKAVRRHVKSQPKPQPKAKPVQLSLVRRYHRLVRITSEHRVPMSPGWIYWEYSRRDGRTSHERGKAARKRHHKPEWRSYEKY